VAVSDQLARARELIGYSQEQAAATLGVHRVMISYWESGRRKPNDRQLAALARLYRVTFEALVSEEPIAPPVDLGEMLLRTESDLPDEATPGVRDFVTFLDTYAKLAVALGTEVPGLHSSPFMSRAEFDSADDARRKAEEVRAHLRLGLGPVSDIDWVCDLLGITVYRADLGADLRRTISGAFLNHPDVGFAIVVNLTMTPGRRRFTVAHEIAHALFHSDKDRYVVSRPTRDPRERFADAFAGEFLVPTEGMRRFMEENRIGPRITDPADVVHIQRYFKVSYPTALVRLRKAKFLTADNFEAFQQVRPVLLARALGYELDDEEYAQDPELWRLARFPRRFLHLLRAAVQKDVVSVPTAAAMTGLTIDEIAELVSEQRGDEIPDETATELAQYAETGVIEAAR
jgi:Zn-dependent peptidase ImmA (M78 family)/transcriptional regulator with XRE-family HTH domain